VLLVLGFSFAATTVSSSASKYVLQEVAVLTFTVNLFASAKQNMGPFLHLWPFAMEEQWFVVLTLGAMWLRRSRLSDARIIDVLLAVAALSSLDEIVTANHSPTTLFRPDAQLAPLAIATALAISRSGRVSGWRALAPSSRAAVLSAAAIAVTVLWGTVASGHAAGLRVPVVTWSMAILLAHVTAPGAPSRVVRLLGSPVLVVPGEYATAFYLWHYPMLHLVGSHPDRTVGTTLALLASAAASVATVFVVNKTYEFGTRRHAEFSVPVLD